MCAESFSWYLNVWLLVILALHRVVTHIVQHLTASTGIRLHIVTDTSSNYHVTLTKLKGEWVLAGCRDSPAADRPSVSSRHCFAPPIVH
jgi:hypothetical protein